MRKPVVVRGRPVTPEEAGKILGVPQRRIRQLIKMADDDLRRVAPELLPAEEAAKSKTRKK